jgi:hypothetical protein
LFWVWRLSCRVNSPPDFRKITLKNTVEIIPRAIIRTIFRFKEKNGSKNDKKNNFQKKYFIALLTFNRPETRFIQKIERKQPASPDFH